MIERIEKKDCCGCTACVQTCPRQCLSLIEDDEGFLYPTVDKERCVDCGLCKKVCPCIEEQNSTPPQEVLAVKNSNEKERMRSSSGGTFVAIAREVIEEGGVVFGVMFNKNWDAEFSYAEKMEDIFPMMGSKYIQAINANAYRKVENFLKEGRKVLFTGCPCHVAGLHKFLRKDYSNLISVDILCHGVPSPGVWHRFFNEMFSEEKTPIISDIVFRDKTISGWKNYNFVVRGKYLASEENTILVAMRNSKNPYMRGFVSNLYLRPSCYYCKCKNGASHSDITLGDYWGISCVMSDFDDDKGVSLVLINSQKGNEYFGRLNIESRISPNGKLPRNGGLNASIKEHPKREIFFQMYNNGVPICEAIHKCLCEPIWIQSYKKTKRFVKRLANKVLGQKVVNKIKNAIR